MSEQLRILKDQELDDLNNLVGAPVLLSGKSQDVREVSEWFHSASTVNAQPETGSTQPPFVAFKPTIATATIRRRGVKSAPRCFGSPFLFEPTETVCRDCRFRDRCALQAAQQALGLSPGRRLPAQYPDHLMGGHHDKPEFAATRHYIREYYIRQSSNSRRRNLAADREYQRKRRAKPAIASIDTEFRARLAVLRRAVAASRHDKRLEQLCGRETQVARAWKAGQLARLEYGPAASKEKIAQAYRTLAKGAVSYSRHQARNDVRLIDELEKEEQVWGRFKKLML